MRTFLPIVFVGMTFLITLITLFSCIDSIKDYREAQEGPYWEQGVVEYAASRSRETLFGQETIYVLVIKVNDRLRIGKTVSKEVYMNCHKGSIYINKEKNCI